MALLFQVHDRLWPIPVQQLVALRSEGMRLYRKHFSSVENIVNTVFEVYSTFF
jgi:hypothetical protein